MKILLLIAGLLLLPILSFAQPATVPRPGSGGGGGGGLTFAQSSNLVNNILAKSNTIPSGNQSVNLDRLGRSWQQMISGVGPFRLAIISDTAPYEEALVSAIANRIGLNGYDIPRGATFLAMTSAGTTNRVAGDGVITTTNWPGGYVDFGANAVYVSTNNLGTFGGSIYSDRLNLRAIRYGGGGTLTVFSKTNGGPLVSLGTVDTSGAHGAIATNWNVPPGYYQMLVSNSSANVVRLLGTGQWSTNGTGLTLVGGMQSANLDSTDVTLRSTNVSIPMIRDMAPHLTIYAEISGATNYVTNAVQFATWATNAFPRGGLLVQTVWPLATGTDDAILIAQRNIGITYGIPTLDGRAAFGDYQRMTNHFGANDGTHLNTTQAMVMANYIYANSRLDEAFIIGNSLAKKSGDWPSLSQLNSWTALNDFSTYITTWGTLSGVRYGRRSTNSPLGDAATIFFDGVGGAIEGAAELSFVNPLGGTLTFRNNGSGAVDLSPIAGYDGLIGLGSSGRRFGALWLNPGSNASPVAAAVFDANGLLQRGALSTGGGGSSTGSMFYGSTATVLTNGEILVVGGFDASGGITDVVTRYTTNGTVVSTSTLNNKRAFHTATLLENGRVLVAGGLSGSNALTSAELYDVDVNTWVNTGSMASNRFGHTAQWFADGVLVTGGRNFNSNSILYAEKYIVGPGSWTASNPFDVRTNQAGGQFVMTPGGNVGIGTPAPAANLDVVGDARIGGSLTVTGAINSAGITGIGPSLLELKDAAGNIYLASYGTNGTMMLTNAGGSFVSLNTNGNLQVSGRFYPSANPHVYFTVSNGSPSSVGVLYLIRSNIAIQSWNLTNGSVAFPTFVDLPGASSAGMSGIRFAVNNDQSINLINSVLTYSAFTAHSLRLWNGSAYVEQIRFIDQKAGLGTSLPTAAAHINGKTNEFILQGSSSTFTNAIRTGTNGLTEFAVGTIYRTNAASAAAIEAALGNGDGAIVMISNALQSVTKSNNVTKWVILNNTAP